MKFEDIMVYKKKKRAERKAFLIEIIKEDENRGCMIQCVRRNLILDSKQCTSYFVSRLNIW